jgi:hypothetical protein
MSNTDNLDLVIIQMDAEVLHDNEINEILPCPPPEYRAEALRRRICEWLRLDVLPKKVLCCIPTMTSETWAFFALFPSVPEVVPCNYEHECIECRLEVKTLLRQYGKKFDPKLVVSQDGRLKNQDNGYRRQEKKITSGWDAVIKRCTQAKRFDTELRDIIQS